MISRREFLKLASAVPAFSIVSKVLKDTVEAGGNHELIKRKVDLTDPAFFTTPIKGKTIFTKQFDNKEYEENYPDYLMNNACGPASITTTLKLFSYLEYEIVPNINIQDVINYLNAYTYELKGEKFDFLEKNGTMRFSAVKGIFDLLSEKNFPLKTVGLTGISIPSFFEPTKIIPKESYPNIIKEAKSEVFEKRGILMAFFWKYGYGHFSIFTNFDFFQETTQPKAFVLDPRGYKNPALSGGGHQGIVGEVSLLDYLEDPKEKGAPKDMLFSLFGIIPNKK